MKAERAWQQNNARRKRLGQRVDVWVAVVVDFRVSPAKMMPALMIGGVDVVTRCANRVGDLSGTNCATNSTLQNVL